jgi:hypothetical protein
MAQAVRKVTAKDANETTADHRLRVRAMAERLGNVSEAFRRRRIKRTGSYDWKHRLQLERLHRVALRTVNRSQMKCG